MWANRFGDTSAVRYPVSAGQVELRRALNETLNPGLLGLFVVPVREQALRSVADGMDLGQLFVSMSFFLIVAALLLTGMLFVFGVQQRAEEMGVLLGLGHRPWQVRRLFLSEGLVVALAGSIAGGLLGTAYTRVLVWSLGRYWHAAVGGTAIQYHAEPMTLVKGTLIGLACAWIAMAIAIGRQSRRPARELLAGDLDQKRSVAARSAAARRTLWISLAALAAAGCALGFSGAVGQENAAYVFFGAGFLLLLAVLGFVRLFLGRLDRWGRMSMAALGARNASRRGGRSLASVALLACGCFIVFGVSAMQQDLAASAHEHWSGTGGFALFGETTLAVPDALESEKGRDAFGLAREAALADASIVSLKVRDGDDASCFNLNRAQAPRLLGVAPEAFSDRDAFARRGDANGGPWSLLEMKLPDGVIPGLAGDANTAMWNLRKAVGPEKGDEIVYRDERGEMFRVKLVGALPMPLSIFQGSVLIARSDFSQRYPSEAGYRMFVVDLPQGADAAVVRSALSGRLDRVGLDLVNTLTRLKEFHAVEATYLGMFLLLGGLGVVLGTVGLGIVLSRNMLERRSELAMLRCVGFTRGRILWLVLAEHWMLLALGIVCGVGAALVAIYPALNAPGVQVPVRTILSLLGGILLAGLGSTALAVRFSLKGNVLPALRSE
jgi:cell division protein FtsX